MGKIITAGIARAYVCTPVHLNKAPSYKWLRAHMFVFQLRIQREQRPLISRKTGNKIKAKYLQSSSATEMLPLLKLPGGRRISLSAQRSSHNTMQGLHLHVSRGDNVICINLMSLSEGEKKRGHLRKQADIVQRPFFPLITRNIGLGLQTKHCYADNQEA